jgi:hypothetical protein
MNEGRVIMALLFLFVHMSFAELSSKKMIGKMGKLGEHPSTELRASEKEKLALARSPSTPLRVTRGAENTEIFLTG